MRVAGNVGDAGRGGENGRGALVAFAVRHHRPTTGHRPNPPTIANEFSALYTNFAHFTRHGGDSAREVAIREVSKFDLRRIESSGLLGGRLADEEAVTDVLRNGLYQERRDAVRDPDPHAVANFSDARIGIPDPLRGVKVRLHTFPRRERRRIVTIRNLLGLSREASKSRKAHLQPVSAIAKTRLEFSKSTHAKNRFRIELDIQLTLKGPRHSTLEVNNNGGPLPGESRLIPCYPVLVGKRETAINRAAQLQAIPQRPRGDRPLAKEGLACQ